MVQASPPRGGGRVQNSPPPMASPSPWARGSSPWRGWVRNSAFQNTGGQDPDKIDWGRNHPKPHPSHPSDFSIELSSDSTLVNIQKQAAADALDAEATLNPNSNGIRSNSNQNAWGRELSHVSEDEEVYGFDENHAVEEEKAESCRAHESEVLGGQAEAAGDGGWQFPTLASRRLQPWEREAEEVRQRSRAPGFRNESRAYHPCLAENVQELELAEFEALERRVRRELGEMSVDHGKPPAEDPKNTAKQVFAANRLTNPTSTCPELRATSFWQGPIYTNPPATSGAPNVTCPRVQCMQ